MKSVRLRFQNRKGIELSAILDLPLGEKPHAYAIFAHCFTCGKNLKGERNISLALTQEGIAVFRFDFAGLGESDGEFFNTNFSTNVADILDAANFLESNYEPPQLLVGHSLGGAAVIMAAGQLPYIKAIATVGAPAEPQHVKHLFDTIESRIQQEGEAQVLIGGKQFVIQRHFLKDIEGINLGNTIRELKKPILILHSPQDQVVGIDNAKQIYKAAWHPKSFLSLDGSDHLLLNRQDSLYAGSMIAAWAQRYLDIEDKTPLVTDKQAVVRTGAKGYISEIRAGNHQFLADEPTSVGGDDLGPTPYDLLIAALGACTGMTLRMYADRKGWDLQEVRVHLEHKKDYPEDAGISKEPKGKLDFITRILELEGNLDESQRKRLLEIADKCPVHRTFHSDIVVKTHLDWSD